MIREFDAGEQFASDCTIRHKTLRHKGFSTFERTRPDAGLARRWAVS